MIICPSKKKKTNYLKRYENFLMKVSHFRNFLNRLGQINTKTMAFTQNLNLETSGRPLEIFPQTNKNNCRVLRSENKSTEPVILFLSWIETLQNIIKPKPTLLQDFGLCHPKKLRDFGKKANAFSDGTSRFSHFFSVFSISFIESFSFCCPIFWRVCLSFCMKI